METTILAGARRRLWPPRSEAMVRYFPGEEDDVAAISKRLFHKTLSPWEWASLAGAPDDADVEVGVCHDEVYLEVRELRAACYGSSHRVAHQAGETRLLNDHVQINARELRSRGFGLRIFCRQVIQAHTLHIDSIVTVAGRKPDENGYYTWPRFGFDGPLPTEICRRLPADLNEATQLADLMHTAAGRAWWSKHGTEMELSFDLAPGSRSLATLRRYLHEGHDTLSGPHAVDGA